jgi:anti-sigma factor RsiW
MSKCRKIEQYLAGFVDGEISNEQYEELKAHLETCAECAGTAASLTDVSDILSPPDEIEMPTKGDWDELWTRIESEIAGSSPADKTTVPQRAEIEQRVVALGRLRAAKRVFLAAAALMLAAAVFLTWPGGAEVTAAEIEDMAALGRCSAGELALASGYGVRIETVEVEGGHRAGAVEIVRSAEFESVFRMADEGIF